jgi:hypothetical protein
LRRAGRKRDGQGDAGGERDEAGWMQQGAHVGSSAKPV